MSTHSSARNLFPPLDNPELTIRRRSRVDPTLLNDFEIATEGNGDPPVLDLHTMEELCGTFMKRHPEECYDLIENITAHQNDWDTSSQWSGSSISITSSSDQEIVALKAETAKINKNLMKVLQINHQVKAVTPNCKTCGGPHSYNDCPATANDAILKNMKINMTSLTNSNLELKNMFSQFMKMNTTSSLGSGTLPSNTITNPKEDLKGITTRSGTAYQGPTIPTTSSSLPKVLERKTEVTKDTPVAALVSAPKPNPKPSILPPQKVTRKQGDPDKFLIPCDFLGMDECLTLADLDASINLMPLSMWNKFSLSELNPTLMTLELADLLISQPIGVAEDVFVKVGKFHIPTDFVVVDFDADPQVPLILGRSFLKTKKALINVYKGELTLRVGKEAITFNLDQTSRYSANYNDMTGNQIDVIDMACEEECHRNKRTYVRIKSSDGVFTARKPLTFSRLATMDPPGDIMARTTPPKRCLNPDFIGLQSTVMPMTWSNLGVKEKFRIKMKRLKIPSKFARFLTFRALISWCHSRLHEGISILVAVDYLSKLVEAKALPTNDARVVCKFLKSLFSRFGTPCAIISDRGTHFCNDQFTKVMLKYDVTHRLATAYHPQTSGQVEVSNRGLKRILERTVDKDRASYSDKLDDALWAFYTTFKTPIGCTQYKLVYEKACHLPIELEHKAYWALKHVNFDLQTADDHRKVQLNELNELRDQAYENSLIYKEKTKRLHDSKIKDRIFNVGD
nr:reverse transcriptase domain-containing protein [Tanacetum cinerariifolium]